MEILLIIGFIAAIALPLHLLNKRDAGERELAAAMQSDPRLQIELMCARDYDRATRESEQRRIDVRPSDAGLRDRREAA